MVIEDKDAHTMKTPYYIQVEQNGEGLIIAGQTPELVCGLRTVNIMDCTGVLIQSTDHSIIALQHHDATTDPQAVLNRINSIKAQGKLCDTVYLYVNTNYTSTQEVENSDIYKLLKEHNVPFKILQNNGKQFAVRKEDGSIVDRERGFAIKQSSPFFKINEDIANLNCMSNERKPLHLTYDGSKFNTAPQTLVPEVKSALKHIQDIILADSKIGVLKDKKISDYLYETFGTKEIEHIRKSTTEEVYKNLEQMYGKDSGEYKDLCSNPENIRLAVEETIAPHLEKIQDDYKTVFPAKAQAIIEFISTGKMQTPLQRS
jgi:hypothetical protein